MLVGVLALQGDFREHQLLLERLGYAAVKVRTEAELNRVDALIIPGGESTAISKLAQSFGLIEPLQKRISEGLPVLGTCAGLIMLSDSVDGAVTGQKFFGGLPCKVSRNAYGGQSFSFEAEVSIAASKERVAFIRAPKILDIGSCEMIADLAGEPVAIRHQNVWGASFHPEITGSTVLHKLFLDSIKH